MARQPLGGLGRLMFRGFTITLLDTPHSVGLLWTRDLSTSYRRKRSTRCVGVYLTSLVTAMTSFVTQKVIITEIAAHQRSPPPNEPMQFHCSLPNVWAYVQFCSFTFPLYINSTGYVVSNGSVKGRVFLVSESFSLRLQL
jgi:hypothetical protein